MMLRSYIRDYYRHLGSAHPSNLALDKEGNVWFTEMGMYFRKRYQNKIGVLVP